MAPMVRRWLGLIVLWLLLGWGLLGWGTWGCRVSPEVQGATLEESGQAGIPRVYRREQVLMGTGFEIHVVSGDAGRAARAIEAAFVELARIEDLLSEWRPTSEISAVNREAGLGPVPVGEEAFEVISRALALTALTEGAFDITFASCGHLWSVGQRRVPTEEEISACLPHVGSERVVLDEEGRTIGLASAEVRIGLGAIGKGYGVDRAAKILREQGMEHFVVNGGGDVHARGRRIDRPWRVGVAHPRRPGTLLGTVVIEDAAVVTSGDWERYFELDGVRYHHIIDPRTGLTARHSMAVTVIAENATDADALATGLFVLGPETGLAIADMLPGVEALIIDSDGVAHATEGFRRSFEPSLKLLDTR